MSLLHFRYKERRRTVRVSLSVPLTIHGKFEGGEKFCVRTNSQSVNRHGALFPLETPVTMGQTLLLVNDITAQGTECRVVAVRRGRDGTRRVTHVSEVLGMEADTIILQDIYLFEKLGLGPSGSVRGRFYATGIVPKLLTISAIRTTTETWQPETPGGTWTLI